VSLFTVLRSKAPAPVAVFAVFFALFSGRPVSLCAQTGGAVLGLGIEAELVLDEVGSIWTVTILVDHPVSAEVRVQPPALPSSLHLERVRVLPKTGGGVRRTLVEYDFLVLRKDTFTLGSFEVSVPGKRGLTPPLTIHAVASGSPGMDGDLSFPRLFWAAPSGGGQGPPATLRTGEPAEIALWYVYPPGVSLPAEARSQSAVSWYYRPALPVNAILEILPGPPLPGPLAASGHGETGVLLRLRIIPLEGPALSLPETRLILAGSSLTVPALELCISAGKE
jgi:hypothetical protein